MRQQLTTLVMSMSLLGLVAVPAIATQAATTAEPAAVSTQSLEHEIAELRQEVNALKHAKQPLLNNKTLRHGKHHFPKKNGKSTVRNSEELAKPDNIGLGNNTHEAKYLPVDIDVPGKSYVSSGPYIGIPLQYSGSNLIINSPSVNQDVSLLNIRKNVHTRLLSYGVTEEPDHSHVLLSGIVEGEGIYKDLGKGANSSDIDLTSAGLDAYILGPSNISALLSLAYDNDLGTNTGSYNSNSRGQNSRVFVKQAFVTIGDFTKSPYYVTFGQLYVPFGTYSSSLVSGPLTQSIGRTRARAIVVGFQQQAVDAFYGSVYGFRGDSHAGATSRVNNGGLNLGYRFVDGKITGDFGAGVIANIADSVGMQSTGNHPYFDGFGGANNSGNEKLVHRVPAYDLRGLLGIGDSLDFIGEYVTASTRFNPNDLAMNNHGAKPQAIHIEGIYTFNTFARPSSVALGYGLTRDALALGLPAKRYTIAFNTSAWRNTLESLEFRHDINYGPSNTAYGSQVTAAPSSGKADNIITAQFDMYF
jgi:hypothetical protein